MCMPAWQGSPSSVLESMANGVRGMSVSFLIANFLIADLPLWACSAFAACAVASLNSSDDTCKAGPSHVILRERHPGIISNISPQLRAVCKRSHSISHCQMTYW